MTIPIPRPARSATAIDAAVGGRITILLDSGAFHTVLSSEAALRLGVVATGEAPIFTRPPWLEESDLWVGVGYHFLHFAAIDFAAPSVAKLEIMNAPVVAVVATESSTPPVSITRVCPAAINPRIAA